MLTLQIYASNIHPQQWADPSRQTPLSERVQAFLLTPQEEMAYTLKKASQFTLINTHINLPNIIYAIQCIQHVERDEVLQEAFDFACRHPGVDVPKLINLIHFLISFGIHIKKFVLAQIHKVLEAQIDVKLTSLALAIMDLPKNQRATIMNIVLQINNEFPTTPFLKLLYKVGEITKNHGPEKRDTLLEKTLEIARANPDVSFLSILKCLMKISESKTRDIITKSEEFLKGRPKANEELPFVVDAISNTPEYKTDLVLKVVAKLIACRPHAGVASLITSFADMVKADLETMLAEKPVAYAAAAAATSFES